VFKYVQRLRPVAGTKNTKIDELLILEGMESHKNVLKEVYKKIFRNFCREIVYFDVLKHILWLIMHLKVITMNSQIPQ